MFQEKYTTLEKISKEDAFLKTLKPEEVEVLSKSKTLEKDKAVITNDTFASLEMQELLINTMRNK